MKHLLGSFALAAGLGILALTACEKTQVEIADSTTQTSGPASTEFAKLKQPNGKPINSHLAAMVALSIDQTNKYNLFYNKLTRAQEKVTLAQTEELLKKPLTAQTFEQLVRLEGYADLAEYKAAEAKYEAERALLLKKTLAILSLAPRTKKMFLTSSIIIITSRSFTRLCRLGTLVVRLLPALLKPQPRMTVQTTPGLALRL